jgi:hypothetical protein
MHSSNLYQAMPDDAAKTPSLRKQGSKASVLS